MGNEYKTLVLVDHSASVSGGNRAIIEATLTYLFKNKGDDKYALATYDEKINYLTDYEASELAALKAVKEISYGDYHTCTADIIMGVINDWSDADFAMRNIILISDGLSDESKNYSEEELLFNLNKEGYPIYVIGCVQDNNDSVMKDLAAIARISGGEMLYTDFVGSDAEVEKMLCEEIFTALNERREVFLDEITEENGVNYTASSELSEYPEEYQEEYIEDDIYDVEEQYPEEIQYSAKEYSGTIEQSQAGTIFTFPDGDYASAIYKNPVMIGAVLIGFIFLIIIVFILLCIKAGGRRKKAENEFLTELKANDENSNILNHNDYSDRNAYGNRDTATGGTTIIGRHFAYDDGKCEEGGTRLLFESDNLGEISLEDMNDPTKYFRIECQGKIVVGRLKNAADIAVDYDDSVSARHCEIGYRGMEWYIKDLNSSNGTYLNGQKVFRELGISSGDLIRLGHAEFRIKLSGGGDTA